MLTSLLITALSTKVLAQDHMRMFLSIAPKRPGAAYDKVNNPDRFRSVADMDMICADDAATLFPGQPSWEFMALSCDSANQDMRAKFPSWPGVELINEDREQIAVNLESYFQATLPGASRPYQSCVQSPVAPTGCTTNSNDCVCWDGDQANPVKPLTANLARVMRDQSSCLNYGGTGNTGPAGLSLTPPLTAAQATPPGADCNDPLQTCYEGNTNSLVVVTGSPCKRRYFWNACDAFGNLEDTNLPQADVTCSDWRFTSGNGYVQDIGVVTGTGSPGHRTGSVACDSDYVHVMCMQVIGQTALPNAFDPPLFIFKTNCRIWDDGTMLRIVDPNVKPLTAADDIANPGDCPDPVPGLAGFELLDWLCNNDPKATPNLIQPPCTAQGASQDYAVQANPGPPSCDGGDDPGCLCSDAVQTHGPYKAVICTADASMNVNKQRFLDTKSTKRIDRYHAPKPCTQVNNEIPCNGGTTVFPEPYTPAARLPVADDYQHYFAAMEDESCGRPLHNDAVNAQQADPPFPTPPPANLADQTVATGCGADGLFDNSGDCNMWMGGRPADNDPYQIRHWDAGSRCGQLAPTQDCTSDRQLPLLCLELDIPIGIVRGDPHFVSFSGGAYDVHGNAGRIYNVITDRHFQFNSLFVAGTRTSTYMGGIGLVFNNHTVWWQATMDNRTRNEKVIVDGQVLKKNVQVSLMEGTGYHALFTKKSAAQPPRLEIKVPGYVLKFTYKHAPRRQYGRNMYESNTYRPHYFDFAVVRTFEKGHAFHTHGLLGQTARLHKPVKPHKHAMQGEGVIDGSVEEYRVNDIFSNDFKYNEFDAAFHWKQ